MKNGGHNLIRLPPRASMRALRGDAEPWPCRGECKSFDFNKNEDLCYQMA
jgi:hypothetical protein